MATRLIKDHHSLNRNLKLNGNYISNDGGDEGISIADNGDVTVGSLITNNISPAGTITIDAAGDIILDAAADDVGFKRSGDLFAKFNSESTGSTTSLTLYEEGGGGSGSADYLKINVAEHGATTISTVDDNGAVAHLTLAPDGDCIISGASLKIDAGKALYLDGGGNTYIYEPSADTVRHVVGGDVIMSLKEDGNSGNTVNFLTSCAGFTQFEPIYDATDTNVYFARNGNKAHLTFTSASETIVDIIMAFPAVSCNCVLLIKQHASGGGAVTNWKTLDADGGNESTVVWAGGSAPTLTTGGSKIDIMSFYWDADNNKAYGVASLNF